MEALTRDELLRLLGAAIKRRERDWLLFLVSYWHGLRVTEAIELTPANFSDGYITVARLKGSRQTTHPLLPHSNPLLDECTALPPFLAASAGNDGGRLFPISRMHAWRLVQSYGAAASIPSHKLHPHVFKHSIAMAMRAAGIGVEKIQAYLGHRSGASTMEYMKATVEEAAAALAHAEDERTCSPSAGLDSFERVSAQEQLRRVLRMLEQSEARGSRRGRARQ